MERKDVIAQLVDNGATVVKGVKVKNVTVTPMEEWVRLGLTLDKPIKGYQKQDDESWQEGESNVVFVSAYTIAALLKECDETAFAANTLLENPNSFSVILSRAIIDIVQERVEEGTEYKNPFNVNSNTITEIKHDTIINHVVKLELSEFGLNKLDKLADKMMGF